MTQKYRFWNERGKIELFLANHSGKPKVEKIANHFSGTEYTKEEAEEVFIDLVTLCFKYDCYAEMAKRTIRRRKWLFAISLALPLIVGAIIVMMNTSFEAELVNDKEELKMLGAALFFAISIVILMLLPVAKLSFIASKYEQLRSKNFAEFYKLCRWLKELTEKYEIDPTSFTISQEMFDHFIAVGSGH